jgi:hypothetical protein
MLTNHVIPISARLLRLRQKVFQGQAAREGACVGRCTGKSNAQKDRDNDKILFHVLNFYSDPDI